MKNQHYGHLTSEKEHSSQTQWYKSRGVLRASMKARQMFTWIFGKEDSKFKNCENLHILQDKVVKVNFKKNKYTIVAIGYEDINEIKYHI